MSAIVIAEMDGTITYVNQAFLQLWGNDPEQVIGRSVMLFWGEPEQVADLMAATPREGKWMGELVARQRDQSPRVIEVLASVVTDMVGRPIRIMSSFIDITERKQNEAARHAQSQELARINEELVRAARLQDEFLASMSHELRTPLTVILGNAEMLYENMHGMLTERQLRLVQTIEESGQRLLGLINNILDLSKALAHKITLSLGPVVVASFGQICLRKIADAAYQKKQTVHLSLDQAVQVIQADEPRLLQILLHLLSNAVKFTPEAGELGLEVHGDLGAHEVHLTVWDTGIGIAPDDQARLFQPFVQIDSRLSREYEGTGLGLALAASLAELHHGRITMMSVLGQGSRFTLILPWEPELRPTQRSRRTSP
jgi:PAS domain S-box-containing protein